MDELPRKTEAEKIVFFGKVKDKSKKKKRKTENTTTQSRTQLVHKCSGKLVIHISC